MLQIPFDRYTPRDRYAALALIFAVESLADAERRCYAHGDILRLCDEVIRLRLRVQLADLAVGVESSHSDRVQMIRDRLLLNEAGDGAWDHSA
jgi:hypothetical protein